MGHESNSRSNMHLIYTNGIYSGGISSWQSDHGHWPYCHGGPKSIPLQTIPVTHLVIRDLYDLNGLSK